MTNDDASRQAAEVLYDLEIGLLEANMSKLEYDEEKVCFRFRDGRFAFSRTRVNWKLLQELHYDP